MTTLTGRTWLHSMLCFRLREPPQQWTVFYTSKALVQNPQCAMTEQITHLKRFDRPIIIVVARDLTYFFNGFWDTAIYNLE